MYIRDKGLNNTDKQLPWGHGERAILCGRVTVLSQILGAADHPSKILPNSGLQVGSFFASQKQTHVSNRERLYLPLILPQSQSLTPFISTIDSGQRHEPLYLDIASVLGVELIPLGDLGRK